MESVPVVEDGEKAEQDQPQNCCQKYFCVGQTLEKELQDKLDAEDVEWTVKYRKQIAMLVPFALVHIVWWTAMIRWDSWHKFTDKVGQMNKYKHLAHSGVRPWFMSVTMIFGSMIAGMTSEGGASVAFPVMTLAMDIKPHVAKQFSYMIQSVGMTAAAFVILYMQVRVEWKSITYCSVGGLVGLIYGLEEIAPILTPPYSKMYFVVIWGSFAASLYYLNRIHGRKVYLVLDPKHIPEIWKSADLTPYWWANLILNWKALILLAAGFIGGIFTSISGSGIDICSFSVLTLLFRLSEKTATPSVVLMAFNTVVAMCYVKWMTREGLEEPGSSSPSARPSSSSARRSAPSSAPTSTALSSRPSSTSPTSSSSSAPSSSSSPGATRSATSAAPASPTAPPAAGAAPTASRSTSAGPAASFSSLASSSSTSSSARATSSWSATTASRPRSSATRRRTATSRSPRSRAATRPPSLLRPPRFPSPSPAAPRSGSRSARPSSPPPSPLRPHPTPRK